MIGNRAHQVRQILRRREVQPKRLGARSPLAIDFVQLTVYLSIFTYIVSELRGGDELGIFGSYHLHCADLTVLVGGIALLLCGRGPDRSRVINGFAVVVLAIAALSLLRGLMAGAFQCLFDFRTRAVTLIFIGLAVRQAQPSRAGLERALVFGTIAFLAIFAARSVLGPTLFLNIHSFTANNIYSLESRSLNADSVLFLGLACAMFLGRAVREVVVAKRTIYWTLFSLAFVVIILSRQRTAGAAGLIAIALVCAFEPRIFRRGGIGMTVGALLFVSIFAVLAFGVQRDVWGLLPESVRAAAEQRSTLTARQEVWKSAGRRFSDWDVTRKAIGRPAGEPLDLATALGRWQASVHSAYVGTLLNYGLLGVCAWAGMLFCAVAGCVRAAIRNTGEAITGMSPAVGVGWMVGLLVYGISYEWRDAAGLFLALPMASWGVNLQASRAASIRVRGSMITKSAVR